MLVRDEATQPLGLGEVVGRGVCLRLACDQRVFQHALKGLPRNVARRKRSGQRVRDVAAHRADVGSLERLAIEHPPGHRIGAAPLDPFLAKVGLAAGKEPQVGAHACSIVGDEAFEPAIVVAMPVAQNKAVDPARIEIEQFEVSDQHLGRIAKVQQVPGFPACLDRFQMQRQAPFAGKGRSLVPVDVANMLDFDHLVRRVGNKAVVNRVDKEPDREAVDDRGCERFGFGYLDAHRPALPFCRNERSMAIGRQATDPDKEMPMTPRQTMRSLIARRGYTMAPGAFDTLTARLVEQAGFAAVYLTGGGYSRANGYPDLGLLTLSENVRFIGLTVEAVGIPVIADADTGYGNAINVIRTVREYEKSGVAAFHIEDQVSPKKCGHYEGKEVISLGEMVGKISAAVDTRRDPELIIIARTDARAVEGLQAALDRVNAYLEAGADVGFVEAPQNVEELRIVARRVRGPALVNVFEGGKTPMVPASALEEMGFRLGIYPSQTHRAAIRAAQKVLAILKG